MVTLTLRKEIYQKSFVEKAILAYASIARIDVTTKGDYILCAFRQCTYDENLTVKEFENYLIDLTNNGAR
ncbi:MAG: HxsD-like protein [Eggerthellaceae bacterium]|nr:HxsD-like protein [Eggerthellaceae bacterium]